MKPALTNFKPALTMRTIILLLPVAAISAAAAPIEIGPRVPPPSSMGYTVESILASGERGGMLLAVGSNFTPECNREMGDAMELWNAHKWDEAREAFHAIWSRHPESPWAAEAQMHEACFFKYRAQYDDAEELFVSLLDKYPASIEIQNKVMHYLPHLYALTGRYQTAAKLLTHFKTRPITWQERQYAENYLRVFSAAALKDRTDRRCGTRALALAMASQSSAGKGLRNTSIAGVLAKYKWAMRKAEHAEGFSLQELADFSSGTPLALDFTALQAAVASGRPVLVHLRVPSAPKRASLLPASILDDPLPPSGHFVVVESIGKAHVDLLDPDRGRVRWSLSHFLYRWSGAVLQLPGQHALLGHPIGRDKARALRGGCCGNPPPDPPCECDGDGESTGTGGGGKGDDGLTIGVEGPSMMQQCEQCGGTAGGECCDEKDSKGSPKYGFGLASANLRLKDIPIWMPEAKGPTIALKLVYNRVATQRMADNPAANYYTFGNKWHCNYMSHVTETPDNAADIVMPGGTVRHFLFSEGVYTASEIWNKDSLEVVDDEFVFTSQKSGSKWFFNTSTVNQQHLEKIEDKYGNALTLSYDATSGRLTTVSDAVGRSLSFQYNEVGLVTNVVDSAGRHASFEYENGDLVSMRDMGGLTTTIQYDQNHWPTNVTYPSGGTWHFATQEENVLPDWTDPNEQGAVSITAEDPLGQTHEYLFTGAGVDEEEAVWPQNEGKVFYPVMIRDKTGNNWLHSIEALNWDTANQRLNRTYLSGVNASMAHIPNPGPNEEREYRITSHEWVRRAFDIEGNPIMIAKTNGPSEIHVGYIDGSGTNTWTPNVAVTNMFDSHGNVLSSTILTNCSLDAQKLIIGAPFRTETNYYDVRDNLLWTKNARDQVTRYSYDAKDHLTGITNPLSQVTSMAYDHNGNLTNLVDALFRTNKWFFDSAGREYESLHPDGQRTTKGYDSIGRLAAVTNHGSGLYLQYHYDDLDRLRDVVFPDGTTNHSEYSCCGLDWTRDRLNHVTTFGRDALGRTTSITNAQNCVTEFRYNGADQITNLITWVNNYQRVKRFDYTSTNGFSRLTQVTTPMGKLTRYDYTFRGGLAWRKDGNGNVTKYQYDLLERLVSVTDSNDVELVKMDYDVLGNVTYVSNVHSVFQYAYDGLNRATQAVCFLTNIPSCSTVEYRIDYTFDPVGNVTNRLITGLQGFTDTIRTAYGYDVMNRLTNVVQLTNGVATANAWYAYDTAGRLWKKGYGNGDIVTQTYDSESRLLSMGITNGATMVTRYNYLWDFGGNILAITNNGTNIVLYGYDRAGQLTNEISFTNGIAGFTTNSWVYDEAGNWLNASSTNKWFYDADNELIARVTNGTPAAPSGVTTTVTGQVEPGTNNGKWYNSSAECRGVQSQVSTANGTFSLPNVPIETWGENILNVTVTDVSGNSSQEQRGVYKQITGAVESFRYDRNGNMTNWVNGSTNPRIEWDWADRMRKVIANGTTVAQENWYDAAGRRIAKKEVYAAEPYIYVYDGWDIIGVLRTNGTILETFTRGVGLAGDIGTLVAITRHPAAPSPGRYYLQNNHRGDVIMARNGASTSSTWRYNAFGTTLGSGSDICRFKFSSKEFDLATGLYYYGYRFYAPQWQRWISADPIADQVHRVMPKRYRLSSPTVSGMRQHQFVLNQPITTLDALGLQAIGWPGSGLSIPTPGESDNCPKKKCIKRHWEEAGFETHGKCVEDFIASLGSTDILIGIIGVWVPGGDKAIAVGLGIQLAVGAVVCDQCVQYEK